MGVIGLYIVVENKTWMNILGDTTWPEKLSGPQTECKPGLPNLKASTKRGISQLTDTIIQRKNRVW